MSDRILKDGAHEIALNPKYDGLASMVKTGSLSNVNEVLAQELYKPVIENFKSRKV